MRRINSIDIFAGAGGLSIGLRLAGIEAVAAVEMDPDASSTFATAIPEAELLRSRTEDVDFRSFRAVSLVAGGPPCQPFSSGGKRLFADDERDMLPEFLRAVREAQPRAFLLENVPGLAAEGCRSYLFAFLRRFESLGYRVVWQVLNSADYGVPQKRRRLFVVGVRGGTFRFPEPTHGPGRRRPYVPAGMFVRPARIVGEANPSKVFYAKNPDVRPSPYDGHVFNGGGRPIDLSAPCHTILAAAGGNKTHFLDAFGVVPGYHAHLMRGGGPRSGEVDGARRLTVAESAILQTFPRDMKFAGARSSQYRQVGNAVPPLLAKVIGDAVRAAIHASPGRRTKPLAPSMSA